MNYRPFKDGNHSKKLYAQMQVIEEEKVSQEARGVYNAVEAAKTAEKKAKRELKIAKKKVKKMKQAFKKFEKSGNVKHLTQFCQVPF